MATNKEIIDISVRGAGKTQKALKGIGTSVLKVGAAFFAAKGLVRGMQTIVQDSAKLQGVERAFNSMGRQIGFTENSFKKLQQATDGTVSKLTLMTEANNAMMLGVVKSDEEMAKLFDTAQRLGQAIGVDTTLALNSMVTGMGRQSKLMLDNLGIMVNTQDAYDKYAFSVGKSTDALTDQERKIAFNNEVLRVAGDMVDELGEEQLTTADKMSRLGATFEDMGAKIGTASDGFINSALDGFQNLADGVSDAIDFSQNIDFNATMTNLKNNFDVIFNALGQTIRLTMDIIPNALGDAVPKTLIFLKDMGIRFFQIIGAIAQDLFIPISQAFEVLVFDMSSGFDNFRTSAGNTFELFGAKVKNIFIGISQEIIQVINTAAQASNKVLGTSFDMIKIPDLIDTEGMKERHQTAMNEVIDSQAKARQKIIAAQTDQSEILDFVSSIIGGTEDEDAIDTLEQFSNAVADVWSTASGQIIETNNAVKDSTNDTYGNLNKNLNDSAKTEFKLTDELIKMRKESANKFVGDLQVMSEANSKFKKIYKAAAITQTLASTYESAGEQFKKFSKAYPAPFGQALGVAAATAAVGSGLARVQQIKKAQYGADFITDGPQLMMVGEGSGDERVQVTPLEDPNIDGPSGQPITVNVQGSVIGTEEFTENTLIPQIREGIRLGERI
jgi:hypothetical protein